MSPSKKLQIFNAILWATAILASAILSASFMLNIIILPGLFIISQSVLYKLGDLGGGQ